MLHKVWTPFVNPFVLNRLRSGKEPYITGVAVDAKIVEVDGDRYALSDSSEITLEVGECVYLRLYGGFFHIETAKEHEQQALKALAEKWQNRPEEER